MKNNNPFVPLLLAIIISILFLGIYCSEKKQKSKKNDQDTTSISGKKEISESSLPELDLKGFPNLNEKVSQFDKDAKIRFAKDFKDADEKTIRTFDEQPDLIDVWKNVEFLTKSAPNIKFLIKLNELQKDQKLHDHLFKGEINKQGKAAGCHHKSALIENGGRSEIMKDTKEKSPDGSYYRAKVKVKNDNGKWIKKAGNKGFSTFFPDDWSQERVLEEIAMAVIAKDVKKKGSFYVSKMSNGLVLLFYKEAKGRIPSAFPKDWTMN